MKRYCIQRTGQPILRLADCLIAAFATYHKKEVSAFYIDICKRGRYVEWEKKENSSKIYFTAIVLLPYGTSWKICTASILC